MAQIEEEENKKAKCKSGCKQGVCMIGSGNECNSDSDCEVCVDNQGGFYGTVSSTKSGKEDENKRQIKILEEEDVLQDRRIIELEKTILERNKQIQELNRYIEYLNRKEQRERQES